MKTLGEKKVNRSVKRLNKQLREDVFGTRFEARQVQKARVNGISYFWYELRDNLQPERNELLRPYNEFEITTFNRLWVDMNNFIVESDFWAVYWSDKD